MRMLLLFTLSLGVAFLASAKEDKKDLVREVELKEPKLEVKKGAKVGEPVKITAHVSDPDGVRSVMLHMQLVDHGAYVRKSDAEYEARWQDVPMHDDGLNGDAAARDGVFTAMVPADFQTHRRLIRYRITATDGTGLGVRVPYPDDECPNFACFVSNDPPAWTGAFVPGVILSGS